MENIGTTGTMKNGKNFFENFFESRGISTGTIGTIGNLGIIGTVGTIRTMENGKTSLRTLMKEEKYL